VAKREDPVGVDAVPADPVARGDLQHPRSRPSLRSSAERLGGGAPTERPVRAPGVVGVGDRSNCACSSPIVLARRCLANHRFRVWWNRSTFPQVLRVVGPRAMVGDPEGGEF
jgi:hypothetical protein